MTDEIRRQEILPIHWVFEWNSEEGRERMRREIPLGRMAEPSEMVGAAIYLASEESTFVIGATIMVDGGYTII